MRFGIITNISMAADIRTHFAPRSISDIVRILTISDIFAALVEHRDYKPTMSREQAYEIIQGMGGNSRCPSSLHSAMSPGIR